jgi:hypothetical protein
MDRLSLFPTLYTNDVIHFTQIVRLFVAFFSATRALIENPGWDKQQNLAGPWEIFATSCRFAITRKASRSKQKLWEKAQILETKNT